MRIRLPRRQFGRIVLLFALMTQSIPLVFAAADATICNVIAIVRDITWGAYVIIIPFVVLGLVTGYIQIAGPFGLNVVKKTGRMNIEMGFVTLFVLLITPALINLVTAIGTNLGGSWEDFLSSFIGGTKPSCP